MVLIEALLLFLISVAQAADPTYVAGRYTFNSQDGTDSSTYGNNLASTGTPLFSSNNSCPVGGSYAAASLTALDYFTLPTALLTQLSTSAATVAQFNYLKHDRNPNQYVLSADDAGLWLVQAGAVTDDVIRFRANANELSYDTGNSLVGHCAVIVVVGTASKMEIWLGLDGGAVELKASNALDGRLSTSTLMKVGTFEAVELTSVMQASLDNLTFLTQDLGAWPFVAASVATPLSPFLQRSNSPKLEGPWRVPAGIGPWTLLKWLLVGTELNALSSDSALERRQNLDRAAAARNIQIRGSMTPSATRTPGAAPTATPSPTPTEVP